jgi:fimbrial chaperone protein
MKAAASMAAATRVAACLFLLAATAGHAASVGIAPVRVNFDAGERSRVVELTNRGSETVSIQADPVLWSQDEDAADVYSDTGDLLVVPRIFSIEPGATQVVRIGRVNPDAAPREQSYRIFFTELAPAEDSGAQLQFRLRLAIPVFIAPSDPPAPKLELIRSGHSEEGFEVVLLNAGNTHVQVLQLNAGVVGELPADEPAAVTGGYLLPGTAQRFLLPVPQHVRVTSIEADTDVAGILEYALPASH